MKENAPDLLERRAGGARGLRRNSTPARSRRRWARFPEQLGVGAGKLYQPIRVAITGTTVSPGIFESVAALGREEALARIDAAIARLGA